jgi:LysM repeat protein
MARSPFLRVGVALGFAAALTGALLQVGYAQSSPTAPLPAAGAPLSATAALTETVGLTATETATDAAAITPAVAITPAEPAPATLHTVRAGDTLGEIVKQYGVTVDDVAAANKLADVNVLRVGQVLVIPGKDGTVGPLPPAAQPLLSASAIASSPISSSLIVSRMTPAGQTAPITSPYYKTTWLTYYGRPTVFVMGILGEMNVISLTAELKEKARVLDEVNGADLRVKPAFHLVHGMATVTPTAEGDYLEYLDDATVMEYIHQGLRENIAVILDVQVGKLSVSEAISPVLPYLKYPNVHLAVDPEFAMSHPNQAVPGNPIGFVTGEQINEATATIEQYMTENKIRGRRIFLVHQFFDEMIIDKEQLRWESPQVELTFCADGWGDPWGKITKYNNFFAETDAVKYTAFKMFYRWDEPVLTEAQSMGVEPYNENLGVQVTPNMIIYQ